MSLEIFRSSSSRWSPRCLMFQYHFKIPSFQKFFLLSTRPPGSHSSPREVRIFPRTYLSIFRDSKTTLRQLLLAMKCNYFPSA